MKNEQSKLGEQFQHAFEDFKPEPSASLWDKIAQRPELQQAIKPATHTSIWKFIVGGASLIAVVVAVIFISRTAEKPAIAVISAPVPAVNQTVQPEPKTAVMSQTQATVAPVQKKEAKTVSVAQNQNVTAQTKVTSATTAIAPLTSSKSMGLSRNNNNVLAVNEPPLAEKQTVTSAVMAEKPTVKSAGVNNVSTDNTVTNPGFQDSVTVIASQRICKGESLTLWANGGTSYAWNTGETTETISVLPSATTTYTVTVTDHTGQASQFNITLTVVDCQQIYIPKAFSPNNDGINDIYKVSGTDISNFTMRIFTRTSQIIFETKDINEGWDGKIKGETAEMGVYVVQISYTDSVGKDHKLTRSLTLLGKE